MSIIQKLLAAAGFEAKSLDSFGESFSFEKFSLLRKGKLNLTENNLTDAYRAHELVFACVNKIADVMNDAEIIVEENKSGEWKRVEGHLLTPLFKRPNGQQTGRELRKLMVQSENLTGRACLHLNRSNAKLPVEATVLNPARLQARWNSDRSEILYYQYTKANGRITNIPKDDILFRRRADLLDQANGFAPAASALKSINSDIGLTEYVDAFFESDGTPSGILKLLNRNVRDVEAEEIKAKWKAKYRRGGSDHNGVAVIDQNMEYQKIGANLNELAADSVSDRFESRICAVFGVPPALVGALVGLKHATNNATAKAALRDFWDNKCSPELAVLREWLTWFVLPEFESLDDIKAGKYRVSYDISQAAFLQEDVNEIAKRARENFRAGGWTLNEFREATGKTPDPQGDYYLQPFSLSAISPENRAQEAVKKIEQAKEPEAAPIEGDSTVAKNAATQIESSSNPLQLPEKKTKKTFDFDGLTLSRQPNAVESLLDLKSLHADFETEKQKAAKILTVFRNELIAAAADELAALAPETVYQLTLAPNPKTGKQVEKVLTSAYERGRGQVIAELNAQKTAKRYTLQTQKKDLGDYDGDEIIRLTDLTISRIINEIQKRAVDWYISLKTLGSYTKELLKEKLSGESEKFIETAAGIAANASIQTGRGDEMEARSDEIKSYQYSALLDRNTCEPCEAADETESDTPADLPDAPNPDCDGGALCRCFIVCVIE